MGTDILKGYVTLDGARICKAEIQLLLPSWGKGHHPVSLHLTPEQPVNLLQVSHCSLLIEAALNELEISEDITSPGFVMHALENAIKYCRDAIAILENKDSSHPLANVTMQGAPPGLTISFGVQDARIFATARLHSQTFSLGSSAAVSGSNGTIQAGINSPLTSSGSHIRAGSQTLVYSPRTSTASVHERGVHSGGGDTLVVRVDSVVPALTATHELLIYCTYSLNLLLDELIKAAD